MEEETNNLRLWIVGIVVVCIVTAIGFVIMEKLQLEEIYLQQ